MTGISLMDLRMKIESNIKPSTMISMNQVTPTRLFEPAMLEYIFWVIPDTMDAKIRRETPFEMPCSVINSPIRINNTDPTVIVNAVTTMLIGVVLMTCPPRR